MKKIIGFLILSFCIISGPSSLLAIDSNESCISINNQEYVQCLVDVYSKEYGVSAISMMATLRNENGTFQFDRQSDLKYKSGNRWGFPAGTREKSYGIAQIHLPDHPEVTYEQAIDPEFSVEFMAREFSQGRQWKWMGYSKGTR